MKIQYHERDLYDILKYYVEGYKEEIYKFEYIIDTGKGKAVIKLYIKDEGDN